MADYTFRAKNTPFGTLVVKFYHVEPYSDQEFMRVRARDFWHSTEPGSGQSWGQGLYQGLVVDNQILPDFIARLHSQCAHCNCLRIEVGADR